MFRQFKLLSARRWGGKTTLPFVLPFQMAACITAGPFSMLQSKFCSSSADDKEISPFSPNWSEDQVADWLKTLKNSRGLNFDVDNVLMPGDEFSHLTKSDLERLTGNTKAGIRIFNAKEKQKCVIPDCVFPESFSLKRQTYIPFDINAKSDRTPILLETTIKRALETIETEAYITGHTKYRVPPVAITSMARSGKTTLLHALFNKILEEGRFNPILVDFNGNGGFLRRDKESDYDAFLRWVATSLLFEEGTTVPSFTCQEQQLQEYLNKSDKPIVLLVDELNALTHQAGQKVPVSKPLAKLLRKMFLDQPARYLCFTSHWFMNLEDVVGQATEGSPSPRNTHFVEVPVTQCVKTINKLLKKNITPVEVAAGVGAVGLLVSIHDQDYIPTQQFKMRTQKLKSYPVESFLEEFCGGDEQNIDMRAFDTFTTRLNGGKIVWPLCFAKAFLHAANEVQLHALIEHAEHSIGLQSSGTGLEWEYTARIAVAIIARCAEFRDLTPIEAQVIGLSAKCRPELHIVQLPEEIQNPESAQEHVDAFVEEECQRYPILVLAYPRYSNFSIFDTITCFKASEGSDTKFTGQQMKQDDTVPGKDAPFDGVLLRGDAPPPSTLSGPRKRKNWKYLDREEVKLFLPYSLHPLIPSEWLRKV